MQRKILVRELLCACLVVASCGGGGDSGPPSGPFIPWSKFRRDNNNTGVGSANIVNNDGIARLFYDSAPPADTTVSSPALAGQGIIYLGTGDGLISLDENGLVRWHLRECQTGGVDRPLGRIVSSPTIIANDEEIIVGTEGTDGTDGAVYRIGRAQSGEPSCLWSFPAGGVSFATRSSPVAIVDPNYFDLISLFIGTGDGSMIALAADGKRRWTFPPGDPFPGNLSSSPAFSTAGLVVAAPNGSVYSLDESGRQLWTFRIGDPAAAAPELLPSAATQGAVFAVHGRTVFSINVDGTERWRYEAADEIAGSPAVSFLNIPRGGGRLTQETLVYTVDRSGTLTAVVNSSGKLARFCSLTNDTCVPSSCPGETECIEVRRCSDSTQIACEEDSECPQGENCEKTGRCADDDTIECTTDTCLDRDDAGLCTREAVLPITTGTAITVESSPALSADSLTIVATTDARICARRIDGSVPGGKCDGSGASCVPDSCGEGDRCCEADEVDCPVPGHCRNDPRLACTPDSCPASQACETPWRDGCIRLPAEAGSTTLSSPVLDRDGAMFVTTDEGLVKIE